MGKKKDQSYEEIKKDFAAGEVKDRPATTGSVVLSPQGMTDYSVQGSQNAGLVELPSIILPGTIDFRIVNLRDQRHRDYLKDMFDDWIDVSESEMVTANMHYIWEMDNLYYESHMVPVGYSDEHLKNFAYSNSGRIDTSKFQVHRIDKGPHKGKVFVTKNMITDVVDRKDAKFAEAERQIIIKADEEQRNDQIEIVLQRYMEKIERRYQLWDQVHYPAIQQKHRLGLWWTQPLWNKRLNYAKGDLEWRSYHPQDVLIDPFPTLKFFVDARYVITKQRIPLDEAKVYLANFGINPNEVVSDEDYYEYNTPLRNRSKNTQGGKSQIDQFVTLYFPEFRKIYIDKFAMEGEEEEIEYEHVYHFQAVYHKRHGVLDYRINKYADPTLKQSWQFSVIPWYEKMSNIRLFPIGMIEPLRKIQDIINIGWTTKFGSAEQNLKVRAFVRAKLADNYGDLVNDFLNVTGGLFPIEGDGDIRQAVMPFNLNYNDTGIMEFTQAMEETFKDQRGTNEITGGKMPDTTRKYLSGETIKQIRTDDYVRNQPDQLSVNWSASQEARRVYAILAMEKKDKDWVDVEDEDTNKKRYIPVNTTWTFEEYNKFLGENYPDLVEMVQNPITGAQEPSFVKCAEEFEKENWVRIRYVTIDPKTGRELEIAEIMSQGSEVKVNHLYDSDGDKWKCEVKVEFDFGFRNDTEETKQLIGSLLQQQPDNLPLTKRYLKLFPQMKKDANDIVKEMEEYNQGQQLLAEIEKRGPEFQQILSATMQKFDLLKSQSKGQGQKAGAVTQ